MNSKLLHTPVGVRDIYGDEYQSKLFFFFFFHTIFKSYGYYDIQTPMFEFFDIFNKERGSVAAKNLYKFFDREGNTLVLRPDMTPSIARSAAKYYMEEKMPIRLCYQGSAFINNSEYQGKLKEFTQMGCELIGDNSSDCDAELIAMVIEALNASNLTEFQIEIGQADFFRGIVEEAELDEETVEELRELLENKKYFGIDDVLSGAAISEETKNIFHQFPELFGSIDMIERAKTFTTNEKSLQALDRLEKIYHLLKIYGYEKYISFDLSMLSMYQYYTGVVFKGYTYGTGDAIVTGGRYDNLLAQFGKKAPAIGFAVNVDGLYLALNRQHLAPVPERKIVLMIYPCEQKQTAIRESQKLRENGIDVILLRKHSDYTEADCLAYAKRMNIKEYYMVDESGIHKNRMESED